MKNYLFLLILIILGVLSCKKHEGRLMPNPFDGQYQSQRSGSIKIQKSDFSLTKPNGDIYTGSIEPDGNFLIFHFKMGDSWRFRARSNYLELVEMDPYTPTSVVFSKVVK